MPSAGALFKAEFQKLLFAKPRYNLLQVMSENCDFADTAVASKNCYYCFGVFYCEDVYYARYSRQCKDSSDLTFCVGCERCIECIDCINGYQLSYCQNCQSCVECTFCFDCLSCRNCFGCVGLYQKQYCLFNQQLSRDEYERRLGSLDLKQEAQRKLIREKLEEVKKRTPLPSLHQFSAEDCVGDNLSESKGCYQCYDTFFGEDCLYCIESNGNKNSCDLSVCFKTERCYSCVQSPMSYNSNFLLHADTVSDSEFCAYSKNLKNCFGCVYLMNKQYYILNQPYAAEEYFKKVAEIQRDLIALGNYSMSLYFVSDYEQKRLHEETDPAIQAMLPNT